MKKIEWFEEDGCLGGMRGLTVDLKNRTIQGWNTKLEPITKDNISDVEYCIEMNIAELNESISKMKERLSQTETKRIKIHDGYKISEPLNEKMRIKYEERLRDDIATLNKLRSISLDTLIKIK
jgi:hypothetical protein